MIAESAPAREPLPSIEVQKPSPPLVHRVVYGAFDPEKPVVKDDQKDPLHDALTALGNQNRAIRKADEEKFAARFTTLSPEDLRHGQMSAWSQGVVFEVMNDVGTEGRGSKSASILRDKLHIPLTGNGGEDAIILQKQLYDEGTTTEGDFYKNFCGNNMNEQLATALTVDDMMHLKTFLTKWMVGTDEAFTALVTLRHSMDMLKDQQEFAQLQSLTGDEPLDPRDAGILKFFHEGFIMKPDEEKKKPSATHPEEAAQEESNQSPKTAEAEKGELSPIRVGMSEDPNSAMRPTMEDAHVIETSLGGHSDRGFYAIYDGHGGRETADAAAKSLHQNLITVLDTERLSPANALRAAYHLTEESMQKENTPGGATALTVLTEGDKIVVANLGDARAVLIHGNGQAERLSRDRKANDPEEQKAVEARHGAIVQGRVANQEGTSLLAVSAAMGDFDFPGIQKDPDIREITRQSDDKQLVLACDGVWDVIRDDEVTAIIGSEKDPQKASDLLIQEALRRGSTDNLSAIVLQFS